MSNYKDNTIDKVAKKINLSKYGSVAGLIVLFLFSTMIAPGNFLKVSNLTNILRQTTVLGFGALGMTIVILTGNIDLSIIGNVSMSSVLLAVLLQKGLSGPLAILIVLIAGMCVGAINGFILNHWKIEAFVVTMGMQVVCFGIAQYLADGRTVIVDKLTPFFINLASSKVGPIPVMFIILICFILLFYLFTKKTKYGRYIYALGGNEEVCYISGVNVSSVRMLAFVLSGFTAALAGIFIFSRSLCGDPSAGNSLGMFVVAAVVIGGTKMSGGRGSVLYTIIGIFIIGIINNILNLTGFQYAAQQIVQGIIIIIAVVLSSTRKR